MKYTPLRVLLAFCALLALQLLYSLDPMGGIQHLLSVLTSWGLLVYFLRAAKDPKVWVWVGLITGILSGVGGIVLNLLKGSLPAINPNALAYFPLGGGCFQFASPIHLLNGNTGCNSTCRCWRWSTPDGFS